MVADYVGQMYRPAVDAWVFGPADRHLSARVHCGWWERVRRDLAGATVSARVLPREGNAPSQSEGAERVVEALVELGELAPEDVQVELLYGTTGQDGRLVSPRIEPMIADRDHSNGGHRYLGSLVLEASAECSFTVRLLPRLPSHTSLPAETPVRWADPTRLHR
jgi:starch phosphorylase